MNDAVDFPLSSDERIELAVHGSLREITRKFRQKRTFPLPLGLRLFLGGAGEFLTDRRKPQSTLVQDLGGKTLFFPQQSQQQMLGPNMTVREALGFFRRVGQNPLAFIAERQVD